MHGVGSIFAASLTVLIMISYDLRKERSSDVGIWVIICNGLVLLASNPSIFTGTEKDRHVWQGRRLVVWPRSHPRSGA